jgi:hypothetical protein
VDFTKLQRVIFGSDAHQVLAVSGGIPPEVFAQWRAAVTLDPLPDEQAVGIFQAAGDAGYFLLARVHFQDDTQPQPIYEYVAIARTDLSAISGNLRLLIDHLFFEPIPVYSEANQSIEPYPIPAIPTLTVDRRQIALSYLFSNIAQGDIKSVLALLGALLHARGLLIRGFSSKLDARLELTQSLMMLVPQMMRPDVTFATQVNAPEAASVRLVFSESDRSGERWVADFTGDTPQFPDLEAVRSPYIDALEALWDGDTRRFAAELRTMELINIHYPNGKTLDEALNAVGERHTQDQRVMNGATLSPDQIKAAFKRDHATPELRRRYAELLLQHALDARDAEAAGQVARLMDEDPILDEALNKILDEALAAQPDAVYFVVRTHLSQGDQPINQRWLPRLHAAALHSLQVATRDSETETLSSWLRLIMREPAAYQLGEVLQQGILAAQERARQDGELGAQLLVFASKRTASSVEMLLNDPALVAALPDDFAHAVRDYEPEAVRNLLSQSRALYLIILSRAAAIPQAARAFTRDTIQQLWTMRADEQTSPMPERYQPTAILNMLLTDGFNRLAADALTQLVMLVITHQDDPQLGSSIHEIMRKAHERDAMILPNALNSGQLSVDMMQSLVSGAINAGILTQQQMLNLYLQLLDMKSWQRPVLPLAEAVARALQQNHALTLPADRIWKLLQIASELRSDQIARVMTRRLTADLEKMENERDLIDLIHRLYDQLAWNTGARQLVLQWWRDFTRQQPLSRLQGLDRALDGRKPLEDLRDILQTTLAIRRIFGKGRTLEDFASAISMAYTILQALSDSFDPGAKYTPDFDQSTLRSELEAHRDELTPDEQRVLAKNLKELSNLIVEMSEHRSRASLIRREEELERQLMKGEYQPQSAIDMMKWFSGYLEGIQPSHEDES